MSPEQARDSSQVTAASDLYSLGAALYDLVTGRPPPAAKTRLAEAIRRLVDLYTAWEKPEDAVKWRAMLEESKPDQKK